MTAITQRVIEQCGLVQSGVTELHTANGVAQAPTYLICLMLPSVVGYTALRAVRVDMASQDVLIGMDVITTGDMSITNLNGNTVFSFRHPSAHEVDFIQQLPVAMPALNREQRRGNRAKPKRRKH
jgi:hypothetical protein